MAVATASTSAGRVDAANARLAKNAVVVLLLLERPGLLQRIDRALQVAAQALQVRALVLRILPALVPAVERHRHQDADHDDHGQEVRCIGDQLH